MLCSVRLCPAMRWCRVCRRSQPRKSCATLAFPSLRRTLGSSSTGVGEPTSHSDTCPGGLYHTCLLLPTPHALLAQRRLWAVSVRIAESSKALNLLWACRLVSYQGYSPCLTVFTNASSASASISLIVFLLPLAPVTGKAARLGGIDLISNTFGFQASCALALGRRASWAWGQGDSIRLAGLCQGPA